jgi:hypothetical protein
MEDDEIRRCDCGVKPVIFTGFYKSDNGKFNENLWVVMCPGCNKSTAACRSEWGALELWKFYQLRVEE